MLPIIVLGLLGLGLAGFMVNRLYVLVTQEQITVKGITYSQERKPVSYWLVAVIAAFGLFAGAALFVIAAVLVVSTTS